MVRKHGNVNKDTMKDFYSDLSGGKSRSENRSYSHYSGIQSISSRGRDGMNSSKIRIARRRNKSKISDISATVSQK